MQILIIGCIFVTQLRNNDNSTLITMTLDNQIRINRWSLMASVDLGTDVNPLASQFVTFFSRVAERNQFDTSDCRDILPIIRGYAMNNPETFSVVECLDLCYVSILDEEFKYDVIDDFEYFLMNKQGWFERYQYARKNSTTAFSLTF